MIFLYFINYSVGNRFNAYKNRRRWNQFDALQTYAYVSLTDAQENINTYVKSKKTKPNRIAWSLDSLSLCLFSIHSNLQYPFSHTTQQMYSEHWNGIEPQTIPFDRGADAFQHAKNKCKLMSVEIVILTYIFFANISIKNKTVGFICVRR